MANTVNYIGKEVLQHVVGKLEEDIATKADSSKVYTKAEIDDKLSSHAVFVSPDDWDPETAEKDSSKVYYVGPKTDGGEDEYDVYVWDSNAKKFKLVDSSSISLEGYWHGDITEIGDGNAITGITVNADGTVSVNKEETFAKSSDVQIYKANTDAGIALDETTNTFSAKVGNGIKFYNGSIVLDYPELVEGTNIQFRKSTSGIGGQLIISATDTTYTQGTGITISSANQISVDNTIALKSDIPTIYVKSAEMSEDGKTVTFTAASGESFDIPATDTTYTQGTGIVVSTDNTISVDNTIALKSDIPTIYVKSAEMSEDGKTVTFTSASGKSFSIPVIDTEYTQGDGITISSDKKISADSTIARKTDIPTIYLKAAEITTDKKTLIITSASGVQTIIPATDTTYNQGTGISISDTNQISIDNTVALKDDIPSEYIKSASVSEDGKTLTITPNEGTAVTVPATDTTYKTGDGIDISDDNQVSVDAGKGLSFDEDSKLIVDETITDAIDNAMELDATHGVVIEDDAEAKKTTIKLDDDLYEKVSNSFELVEGSNISITQDTETQSITISAIVPEGVKGAVVSAGDGIKVVPNEDDEKIDYTVSLANEIGFIGGTSSISITDTGVDAISEQMTDTVMTANGRFLIKNINGTVLLLAERIIPSAGDNDDGVAGVDMFTISVNSQIVRTPRDGYYYQDNLKVYRYGIATPIMDSSEYYASQVGACSINMALTIKNNLGTPIEVDGVSYYGYRFVYEGDAPDDDTDIISMVTRVTAVEETVGIAKYEGSTSGNGGAIAWNADDIENAGFWNDKLSVNAPLKTSFDVEHKKIHLDVDVTGAEAGQMLMVSEDGTSAVWGTPKSEDPEAAVETLYTSSDRSINIETYVEGGVNKINFTVENSGDAVMTPARPFDKMMANNTDIVLTRNWAAIDARVFPISFPSGRIESISLFPVKFEEGCYADIAIYGNNKDTINGAERWFGMINVPFGADGMIDLTDYVSKGWIMQVTDRDGLPDIVKYRYDEEHHRVKYTFNWVVMALRTDGSDGGTLIRTFKSNFGDNSEGLTAAGFGKLINIGANGSIMNSSGFVDKLADDFDSVLNTDSMNFVTPYIQFNIVR